jgi:hypothetical protein
MEPEIQHESLLIVSFNKFFKETQDTILHDVEKFNLTDKKITNKDVKKIFYHHLIKNIIDQFIIQNDKKLVMLFSSKEMPSCQIVDIYGHDEILSFLKRFIEKLENMLPVRILTLDILMPESLLINACQLKYKKQTYKSFTFQKIKFFAKRYDLTYLNNEYLDKIKTKQVLYQ